MSLIVAASVLVASQLPGVQSKDRNRPVSPDNPPSAVVFTPEMMRQQCPAFSDVQVGAGPYDVRECRVSEFGEIGVVDRRAYYYAIYCLMPNYATDKSHCTDDTFNAHFYRERGLAVFVGDRSTRNARLLFERAGEDIGVLLFAWKPEIVTTAAGTILYLKIAYDGTGAGNASEYYLWASRRWMPIEADAWLNDLTRRVPAGLQLRKGVWPDLGTMTAETGLYRDGDANCCPSGGVARIRLAIRARRFVIDAVAFEPVR